MATVLLVDDDEFVREGLTAVLEAEGHDVVEADTLDRAVASIESDGDRLDLVLLDLWLPDGSGLRLLERMAAETPDLPVIVMSGGGPGRSLEQALAIADASGASAAIIKPFQNDELIEKVNGVLNQR